VFLFFLYLNLDRKSIAYCSWNVPGRRRCTNRKLNDDIYRKQYAIRVNSHRSLWNHAMTAKQWSLVVDALKTYKIIRKMQLNSDGSLSAVSFDFSRIVSAVSPMISWSSVVEPNTHVATRRPLSNHLPPSLNFIVIILHL